VLEYDFEKSIGYWVASTAHALRRALDVELSRESITFRQWEVLAWIVAEGEQSQVELADRLCIEAPTLAGIVSRMERDGWLVRFACPDDRRCKRIRVTEKAEQVWNKAVECCLRVRTQATDGISEHDLAGFRRVCSTILANLGEPALPSVGPTTLLARAESNPSDSGTT
jgi:DNA-binding MarR family transcriptional regulator